MALVHRLASGLRALVSRRRTERDLDDELDAYVHTAVEQKMDAGLSREAATRAVRVEMGSVEAVKDNVRDVMWESYVDSFLQDVRFAVRSFTKTPRFTIPALVALALGIGGTSAIFSVVRSVMLEPLPYRDPDRIVTVWETNRGATAKNVIAPANFAEWRERSRSLEHLGMIGAGTAAMIIDGQADKVSGATFTSQVFDTLGVRPALGRAYTAEEDTDGRDAVIVLSHEFWQRRLGGRADVLGMGLVTDGRRRAVVGVMPAGFTVLGQKVDFVIPYGMTVEQMRAARGRGASFGIARLRDGVSLDQAATEMRLMAKQLETEFSQRNAGRTVWLVPVHEQMVGDIRPALLTLVGAVILVLLVACVNVANLLLARSAAREAELGMRTALGAGRGRLVRQMLTESLVLAGAGGLVGFEVAALCHRGLLALVGERIPIPRIDEISLDPTILAFTLFTALATGLVFGLLPAFVSTSHAGDAIRDGGRHGGGRRLRRALGALVVVEVALSLVLLAGAGLLLRSFVKLQNVDPGFRPEGVLTARVQLPFAQYDVPKSAAFFREALSQVAALPGVESVAGFACTPLAGSCIGTSYWRLDRPKPPDGQISSGQIRPVTPGGFKTLGIPQLAGRDFSEADTPTAVPVAIVSESLVKLQFPGEDPLGRFLRINMDHANGRSDMEWRIVGIVADIKGVALDVEAKPTVYVPYAQTPGRGLTLMVRSHADPLALAASVTRVVRGLDPEVPIADVGTYEGFISNTIARPRAITVLVGVFAAVALLLAGVGVYGVMAYSVLERTQEIGIRVALGADASAVFRLVIGNALQLVGIGVAVGLLAAGALTRLLQKLLFQIQPLDPWTFGVTALGLLVIATLASYVPARRGMRIAPVEALRTR